MELLSLSLISALALIVYSQNTFRSKTKSAIMASTSGEVKTPPPTKPKPRSRSFSVSPASGQGKLSELKAAITGKRDKATQWQMKATEFYERILQQIERLLQTVKDEGTVKQVRTSLQSLHFSSRSKLNPDQFWAKAEELLNLLQRIELQQPPIVNPPPT